MIDKSFWYGKRVLVTGHTGFKGSWLLLWLQELGAIVWGYGLGPQTSPSLFNDLRVEERFRSSVRSVIGDLTDIQTLSKTVEEFKPEVVFHLGAQALVRESYKRPVDTWMTNVIGSLSLLECLKLTEDPCVALMITTDKVYKNMEWVHAYRETDVLGGRDPYSASKAGAELAIQSWRDSFCGSSLPNQNSNLTVVTARSGNVIGGGDWSADRLVPDIIRSLQMGDEIAIRNPKSKRPWQHVLEPLRGYLMLAEYLSQSEKDHIESVNFGPSMKDNRSVSDVLESILSIWPGRWKDCSKQEDVYEAKLLNLSIELAYDVLKWEPVWNFDITIKKTTQWYLDYYGGSSAFRCCLDDIESYMSSNM